MASLSHALSPKLITFFSMFITPKDFAKAHTHLCRRDVSRGSYQDFFTFMPMTISFTVFLAKCALILTALKRLYSLQLIQSALFQVILLLSPFQLSLLVRFCHHMSKKKTLNLRVPYLIKKLLKHMSSIKYQHQLLASIE